MLVNNNYQPNFKGVIYTPRLKMAIENGSLNKKNVLPQIENFKKNYEKSPVTAIIGFADAHGKRLDAQILYGKSGAEKKDKTTLYLTENYIKHHLGFSPKSFFDKVALNIESIEETYQIGKYAK